MRKKFLRTSLLLSTVIATTLTTAQAVEGEYGYDREGARKNVACLRHCICGVRTTYEATARSDKTSRFYSTTVPATFAREERVLNSSGSFVDITVRENGRAVSTPYTSDVWERVYKVREACSLDGLLCGLVGWLNLTRYCKEDPCSNTNDPAELMTQCDSCDPYQTEDKFAGSGPWDNPQSTKYGKLRETAPAMAR